MSLPRRFAVSFDALNTVIEVSGGVGFQYRRAFARFLASHGVNMDEALPAATEPVVNTVALDAIHAQVKEDRRLWAAQHPGHNPKEMPFGGADDTTLLTFWRDVLTRVFTNPALYEGATPASKSEVHRLQQQGKEWDTFVHHLIFDVFGSTEAHGWLPAGKRTLEQLRAWNEVQRRRPDARLVLAQPPFIISNMDPRLATVMRQLGALPSDASSPSTGASSSPSSSSFSSVTTSPAEALPPLVGKVLTAREVGFAKPSTRGLVACAEEAGIVDMSYYIHVGDADADEKACNAAGCRFVRCNGATGVVWEDLKREIEELEKAVRCARAQA